MNRYFTWNLTCIERLSEWSLGEQNWLHVSTQAVSMMQGALNQFGIPCWCEKRCSAVRGLELGCQLDRISIPTWTWHIDQLDSGPHSGLGMPSGSEAIRLGFCDLVYVSRCEIRSVCRACGQVIPTQGTLWLVWALSSARAAAVAD